MDKLLLKKIDQPETSDPQPIMPPLRGGVYAAPAYRRATAPPKNHSWTIAAIFPAVSKGRKLRCRAALFPLRGGPPKRHGASLALRARRGAQFLGHLGSCLAPTRGFAARWRSVSGTPGKLPGAHSRLRRSVALSFSKLTAFAKKNWRALGESNPSYKIENLGS